MPSQNFPMIIRITHALSMFRICSSFIVLSLLLIKAGTASCYGAAIAWNPNTESDLASYKLYLGSTSRQYYRAVDVGNHTAIDLSSLFLYENAPYYVALKACDIYGNESPYSDELLLELDDLIDHEDNCPNIYNPGQHDNYPPGGNSIGDACDCEGDFDADRDEDGSDAATLKDAFGRSRFKNPCTNTLPCHGDFTCDEDVDGSDVVLFKADFGRSAFKNPCPNRLTAPWCVYP